MLFICIPINAEVMIVVHPSNANSLDQQKVVRLFTGKSKTFPDGSQAIPINQSESTATTEEFNAKVLGRSSSQLKSYWSKLVFTGKGTPPKEVSSDQEVIDLVAANPNVIGYVSAGTATDSVKVLLTF